MFRVDVHKVLSLSNMGFQKMICSPCDLVTALSFNDFAKT